uniref:WW domain-containing protein n=1 Tax=Rhizophora mucronata TaxID=61149 RepID=A0A2P2JEA9_RHIMU
MTAPNMATITESLERLLQNCSLNQHQHHGTSDVLGGGGGVVGRSSSSDEADVPPGQNQLPNNSDRTLELNSHLSLPCHWEQCLDLKTGEIYYIDLRNGMKAREDPRIAQEHSGDFHSEDNSSYDSEESSSESSRSSSREHHRVVENADHVLVVAGCKSCLMYFMVPKRVEDCPKCNGQLLHFDRSCNGFP